MAKHFNLFFPNYFPLGFALILSCLSCGQVLAQNWGGADIQKNNQAQPSFRQNSPEIKPGAQFSNGVREIAEKYKALGGPAGVLGKSVGEINNAANGGRLARYQQGSIYWHPSIGAYAVYGAIVVKWRDLGYEQGSLGYPTSDEYAISGGGRRSNFQKGVIVFYPQAGAHALVGAIGAKYKSLGDPGGYLGALLSEETQGLNGARYNKFQHGFIYWHPSTGAHAVYGLIAGKWQERGFEKSPLGLPTSDEMAASGGGRRSSFQNGVIMWLPQIGAHAVYGTIGAKWLELGAEKGPCGYPVSEEQDKTNFDVKYDRPPKARVSGFQHGSIEWFAETNGTNVKCYPREPDKLQIMCPKENPTCNQNKRGIRY